MLENTFPTPNAQCTKTYLADLKLYKTVGQLLLEATWFDPLVQGGHTLG